MVNKILVVYFFSTVIGHAAFCAYKFTFGGSENLFALMYTIELVYHSSQIAVIFITAFIAVLLNCAKKPKSKKSKAKEEFEEVEFQAPLRRARGQ